MSDSKTMAFALRQAENGMRLQEMISEMGIAELTFLLVEYGIRPQRL
jgi:hypothetical protein